MQRGLMMTLEEIMALTGSLVDEEFELEDGKIPSELLRFYNACSQEISPIARVVGRATADYIPELTEITVPKDFLKRIPRGFLWFNGEEIPEQSLMTPNRRGYIMWGDVIILNNISDKPGTLLMYYYRKLPKFTGDPEEEPIIHEDFHDIYAFYAATRWFQGEPDEYEAKRDRQLDFERRKTDLD